MELTRRAAAARWTQESAEAEADGTFTILTVCTGNICRSPLAEQLLRVGLADVPRLTIASAGTMAMPDDVMPEQAQALSRRFGGEPGAHAARRLAAEQVSEAGLVLAMAREHRSAIVRLAPRATRYAFTVREFARLASSVADADLEEAAVLPRDDVAGRLNAGVAAVASLRGTLEHPAHPDDDDVIDPYRREEAAYALAGEQMVPAVNEVVALLRRAVSIGATDDPVSA